MKDLIDFLGKLHVKKSPAIAGLAAFLVCAAGFAVKMEWLTPKEAIGFLLAAFGLPGFFGLKSGDDEDSGGKGAPDHDPPTTANGGVSPRPPPDAAARHPYCEPALVLAAASPTPLGPRFVVSPRAFLFLPILVALAMHLTGCSWLQGHPEVVDAAKRKSICALQNADQPWEVILVRCALSAKEAEDIKPQVDAAKVGQARALAAQASAACAPDGGAR